MVCRDAVASPRTRLGSSGVAQQLTPPELRSIINHGLGVANNPTQPYMPVWGAVMSSTQVNDLVAYLRAGLPAVPTAEPC